MIGPCQRPTASASCSSTPSGACRRRSAPATWTRSTPSSTTGWSRPGPDGASFDKAADLAAHRSGALRITKLVQEDLDVLLDGDVAITRVTASAEAVQGGVPMAGRLKYTRTWVRRDDGWRVLGAHFSVLP